jgi:integrase
MAKKSKYHQRPDGLFEAIRTINGKRVAFRGKSCREVDRKILEYQEQKERGRDFPKIADEWEVQHEGDIGESTRRVYSYAVKRLKEAFPGPAKEIRPLDIQRYISAFEKQGRSANSVSIELCVCKMIFAHAVISGDIDISPAAEIKKSRGLPVKHREALTEEQEAAVKAAGREKKAHWWLFPYLLLYTGMRRGEALALTYADIDRKAGVIHVTKKLSYAMGQFPKLEDHLKSENGNRKIPLLAPLADALPRNRVGLIFPGADGGYMRAGEITRNWRKYCRDVGLNEIIQTSDGATHETFPITPHCFRHSFATICYEAGLDPRQAAEILGDTPEVLESVYTHLRQQHKATAAQLLGAYMDAREG